MSNKREQPQQQPEEISGVRSMESKHKPLVILRCKVVIVGDACVGKTALTSVFHSGGSIYPKNYVMVVLNQ
jgi:transport family protein 27